MTPLGCHWCKPHHAVRPGNDAKPVVGRSAVAQPPRVAGQVPGMVGGQRGQSGCGRSGAVYETARAVQGYLRRARTREGRRLGRSEKRKVQKGVGPDAKGNAYLFCQIIFHSVVHHTLLRYIRIASRIRSAASRDRRR